MKYHSEITEWGNDALALLENPETLSIILFDEGVPPELAEISVLHTKSTLFEEPSVGDVMIIADKVFTITAVGDKAKTSLRELGHCTLTFRGAGEPERPGCIMLEGDECLLADDIREGAVIELH